MRKWEDKRIERATECFGLGQRNERGDSFVEWERKNFKIMNTPFQKKAGRRWTWRSPDGNTKNQLQNDRQTEHCYGRDRETERAKNIIAYKSSNEET